jgi:hypothetical protein
MKGKITLVAVPVTALVLFAVPSQCEGPVLIPVSPGHGLSLVDMAAIVPLIAALTMLGLVLVRGRDRLSLVIGRAPWDSGWACCSRPSFRSSGGGRSEPHSRLWPSS